MAGRKRYKVDLGRYMAECDINYLRLMRLFPDFQNRESRRIALDVEGKRSLVLRVQERTRYTTLLDVNEQLHGGADKIWFFAPLLRVRLYHDARSAEVVSFEGNRKPVPKCDYPNPRMHHRDEKAQWNHFLGEWLSHCFEQGLSTEELFDLTPS